MTARFASMISIINATVKAGHVSCEVSTNKLGINTLRLLRNQGYLWGFSFTSPKKRSARLYPRVCILFKYIDHNTPILKAIHVHKNTRSNFKILPYNKLSQVLTRNKLYLLTSPQGLTITSLANLSLTKMRSQNFSNSGRILAELLI